ncbi:MAG: oligosaccharide flippase family protein [Lachnospiraceae bacterium]|nr:oligosaccharide flippase family protein [Lachnospiraceae bacterium]
MRIAKTKNAVRNMFFGTVQRLITILMPFLTRTVMLYTLGAEYLGLNSLFTSILQVLNLAELGVGSAMIFSMYKPIAEDDRETICALLRLYRRYYRIIGMLVLIMGIFILPFLPVVIKKDLPPEINVYVLYLIHLSSTVLSYWLFSYKSSLLYAHQRNDIVFKISTFVVCFQEILQLVVLFALKSYYLYLVLLIFSQVCQNIILAFIVKKMFPDYMPKGSLPKSRIKEIGQKIRALFGIKLGSTIVGAVDSIAISAFLGLTVLAIYNNYYYIMSSVSAFIYMFFTSCTAGIGNSLYTNSVEKNYEDFNVLTFLVSWISGVCLSCFFVLYQPFMYIWVGEKLMFDQTIVMMFCAYFYLYVIYGCVSTYKDAAGIWHEDRFRPIITAAINLMLDLIFVQKYGVHAILLSTILCYLLLNIPWLIYNLFHYLFRRSIREFVFKLFVFTFASIIACTFVAFLSNLVFTQGILGFIYKGVISVIVPNILFVLLYYRTVEFKRCKEMVKRIVMR